VPLSLLEAVAGALEALEAVPLAGRAWAFVLSPAYRRSVTTVWTTATFAKRIGMLFTSALSVAIGFGIPVGLVVWLLRG